jgi:hypothetical protein
MEWTKEHDIFLLREMLASNIFHYRKGSPDRGRIWDKIADRLNATKDMLFHIKEKRSVQDRWNLLKNKLCTYQCYAPRGGGRAIRGDLP